MKRNGFTREEYLNGIFKVTDFASPALGTVGDLGRNAFRSPGFARVDLSMAKTFRLTERLNATLRGEAFNALNRVNLNAPSGSLDNNNFGKVTGAAAPRSMQVSVMVRF